MDRREADTALRLARQWAAERLLPPSSLQTLEARYAEAAARSSGESFGSSVLYALGGVLLGAASFALLVLLDQNGVIANAEDVAPWLFLGWGLLCVAVAAGIDLGLRKPALSEAFYVASLVAVTAAAFPRADELHLAPLSMAFALAVLAHRRRRFMVPFLALVAFNVALAALLFGDVGRNDEELAFTLWFPYAGAQVVALVAAGRLAKWPWPGFSLSTATLLLAGSFLGFWFDVVEEGFRGFPGDAEVVLAALMAAAMVAGLALREKGMVLASALVIAIDAIVFAFDVGDLVGGLVAILAVAGLLIWQAGALRRYLREE